MPELVRGAEGREKMTLSPAGLASGPGGIPPRLPAWRQSKKGLPEEESTDLEYSGEKEGKEEVKGRKQKE